MIASKILSVNYLYFETRRFAFGKIRQVKGYLGSPRSLEFRIRKEVTDFILPPRVISDTDRRLAVINRAIKQVTSETGNRLHPCPKLLNVVYN